MTSKIQKAEEKVLDAVSTCKYQLMNLLKFNRATLNVWGGDFDYSIPLESEEPDQYRRNFEFNYDCMMKLVKEKLVNRTVSRDFKGDESSPNVSEFAKYGITGRRGKTAWYEFRVTPKLMEILTPEAIETGKIGPLELY